MIKLEFFTHFQENQSPVMEGRNSDGGDYFNSAILMDKIAETFRAMGLEAIPESAKDTEYNGERGRLFYGGGPMVNRTKRLAVKTVSAVLILKAITASEPLIKDYLAKEQAASIT